MIPLRRVDYFCAISIGLGIGAWVVSLSGAVSADPGSDAAENARYDIMSGAIPFEGSAVDSSFINIAISYDGTTILDIGDARADSQYGGWAIAIGDGAAASAGYGNGLGDFALALGSGSSATAANGPLNAAIAYDGAAAYSGFYPGREGYSLGSDDFAAAFGKGSTSDAAGEMYNTALAGWGGTAHAGYDYSPDYSPSGKYIYSGDHTFAGAFGSHSDASSGLGDSLYALALGDNSHATVGGLEPEDRFHDDWALVFGNGRSVDATGADGLFHFQAGDFTNLAEFAQTFANNLGINW